MMRRREWILGLAATGAASWLRAGNAQRVYRIAVLIHGPEPLWRARFDALRAGLKQLGYVEGGNLKLTARWNEGGLERLPDLAAELLRDKPDVVVTSQVLSAVAVHKQTRTVPIVMASGAGAVQVGVARSLARPGGNVTGVTNQGGDLTQKQIELLKAIAPGISRLGVLTTGKSLVHDEMWRETTQAAQALKLKVIEVRVGAPGDLAQLATVCGKGGCQALLVLLDADLQNWRAQIIDWAARLRLPAVYPQLEYVLDGGLISYGANFEELFRRAAVYVDKILKGANPGDLPIEQPTKFELVVNLKTAHALGIKVPLIVLGRADRVIE